MMTHLHVKYLLIGAGLASSAAAQAIRAVDPQGTLMMVGQETSRPYTRAALSQEYLRGELPRDALFAVDAEWYVRNHVDLRTGIRAVHLDSTRRIVTLQSGQEVSFDRLLVATGASPRHLGVVGADLPNLFYVRTIEDADRLHHAAEQAKRDHPRREGQPGPRAVVIGGGLLGVELAASLRGLKLDVDLLARGAWLWHRFAGEEIARFVQRYLEHQGVHVATGSPVTKLDGNGRVQTVIADNADGQIILPCHLAVAATGVVSHFELLRGTAISAERAILTDAHGQTNVPGIYAAGDCSAIYDPLFEKHRVLDHQQSAAFTGTLVGQNMCGTDRAFAEVGTFDTQFFGLTARVWGYARFVHHRIVRGAATLESQAMLEFGVAADGRLAQIISLRPAVANHEHQDPLLLELVRRRAQINGHEEALKDPRWPLDSL